LAELLRLNYLRPVYHGEHGLRNLKELVRSYLTITKDLGRVMSRVKAILFEAFLLVVGAVGGLGIAWLGIHELLTIAPAHLPRLDTIRIDSTMLMFTIVSSLVAATIFGLAPAWRAARPDVMVVLRDASRNEGLVTGGLSRKIVVGLEVALAYVLLIGSGRMVRSFLELQRIDPGFNAHGLLTFKLQSDRFLKTPQERAVAIRQLEGRLRAIPGVQSVTAASPFPLTGGYSPIRWGTEEALADASKFISRHYAACPVSNAHRHLGWSEVWSLLSKSEQLAKTSEVNKFTFYNSTLPESVRL
jgi:hypothetical protein